MHCTTVALVVCAVAAALVSATPTKPVIVDAHKLPYTYAVVTEKGDIHVTRKKYGNVVAQAQYNGSNADLGWDYLRVSPDRELLARDRPQAFYVSGYLEGYLTHKNIAYTDFGKSIQPTPKEKVWIDKHIAFMVRMAREHYREDPFWLNVASMLRQLEGLADGYTAAANHTMTFMDAFLYNFRYELGDVQIAVQVEKRKQQHEMLRRPQHCSVLIKVTKDDLFMGHDAWDFYKYMGQRQYKVYDFEPTVALSSYPGSLASGDDWYMTSRELAVTETSLGMNNNTLYKKVVPETVSEFIRVMGANYLASNGEEWTRYFSAYNSGTYNNQYMVVDFKRYTPGQPIQDGTLWVAEQIPGYVERHDESEVLRKTSYWASYNIPYYKYIYDVSGNDELFEEFGDFFSYTKYARPEIFHRNQTDVKDVADMMRMQRYNNYKVDPFSIIHNCSGTPGNKCDPRHSSMLSIASRGDLMPLYNTTAEMKAHYGPLYYYVAQGCFGAMDSKIAAWSHRHTLNGYFISGPTNDQQPVFKYGGSICPKAPAGSPEVFDFPWVLFNPFQN